MKVFRLERERSVRGNGEKLDCLVIVLRARVMGVYKLRRLRDCVFELYNN